MARGDCRRLFGTLAARVWVVLVVVGPPEAFFATAQSYVSLCGLSKRSLTEDPVRRFCHRRCIVEDKVIRPTFTEWEMYCRETSGMDNWDAECKEFMSCAYGCDAYYGDRK